MFCKELDLISVGLPRGGKNLQHHARNCQLDYQNENGISLPSLNIKI